MNSYQHYQQARDTAWQVLLKLGIASLPVDAKGAAERMGVQLLPFPNREEEPRLHALLSRLGHAPCRSLRLQGRWHIFLKSGALDDQHAHFAVAHELGHILLRHPTQALSPGVRAFYSRENAGDVLDDPLDIVDYAADIFAIRLLAPACVLHDREVCTPLQIQRLCGLPPKAAQLRGERMQVLRQRNAFFSHPLERQVFDQFRQGKGLAMLAGSEATGEGNAAQEAASPPPPNAPQPQGNGKKPAEGIRGIMRLMRELWGSLFSTHPSQRRQRRRARPAKGRHQRPIDAVRPNPAKGAGPFQK